MNLVEDFLLWLRLSLSWCCIFPLGALDDFEKASSPPAPEPAAASSSSASSGAEKVGICFCHYDSTVFCSICEAECSVNVSLSLKQSRFSQIFIPACSPPCWRTANSLRVSLRGTWRPRPGTSGRRPCRSWLRRSRNCSSTSRNCQRLQAKLVRAVISCEYLYLIYWSYNLNDVCSKQALTPPPSRSSLPVLRTPSVASRRMQTTSKLAP